VRYFISFLFTDSVKLHPNYLVNQFKKIVPIFGARPFISCPICESKIEHETYVTCFNIHLNLMNDNDLERFYVVCDKLKVKKENYLTVKIKIFSVLVAVPLPSRMRKIKRTLKDV
jgi:hypothetical protein